MRIKLVLLLSLICWSCGDQKIDTTKAKAEMEAREIKKVSDAAISEKAMETGLELVKTFTVDNDNGRIQVDFGSDTLYQKSYYLFDQVNALEGKELQLFQAYDYNAKNNLESSPNLQKLEDGKVLLYTAPLFIDDSLKGMWSVKLSRRQLVLSIKN